MKRLSEYFEGVAVKRLSAVEADTDTSNQHEFNGIKSMVTLLGTKRVTMNTDFLYLGEGEDETLESEGFLTWYDAREKNPKRTEYRLYFPTNPVMELAASDDLLVVAKRPDNEVLLVVLRSGSTVEQQVLWLFGIIDSGQKFAAETIGGKRNREVGYVERRILGLLGIVPEIDESVWLEMVLDRFGESFPKTVLFSSFARETSGLTSSLKDPDNALITWINHEEMLFRTLEKHIVGKRLKLGFEDNVDTFLKYSLSVQNRRKSRMGYALENHLNAIFLEHGLQFSTQVITEQNSRPDFLFPGISEYHDPDFPVAGLTVLGAKSSCKERWNQVLVEANRIPEKHLLTLEPGISPRQTIKMQEKKLQLVLPSSLHPTYLPEQRKWIINLQEFIDRVKDKQGN
ncbi:MAG: restriction endonuclease [Bacteroidia bacterium]|nr:restriction endonuclease [Bacteroidia bacterium]